MHTIHFISLIAYCYGHTLHRFKSATWKNRSLPYGLSYPGRVYRCDSDASHTPMFHQVEGLLVAEHVTFSELKGVLYAFVQQMFGEGTRTRFPPSISSHSQNRVRRLISPAQLVMAKDVASAQATGWLEILGGGLGASECLPLCQLRSGTGHPALRLAWGVDRIATLKYGIPDLRLMFDNDMRFVQQF